MRTLPLHRLAQSPEVIASQTAAPAVEPPKLKSIVGTAPLYRALAPRSAHLEVVRESMASPAPIEAKSSPVLPSAPAPALVSALVAEPAPVDVAKPGSVNGSESDDDPFGGDLTIRREPLVVPTHPLFGVSLSGLLVSMLAVLLLGGGAWFVAHPRHRTVKAPSAAVSAPVVNAALSAPVHVEHAPPVVPPRHRRPVVQYAPVRTHPASLRIVRYDARPLSAGRCLHITR